MVVRGRVFRLCQVRLLVYLLEGVPQVLCFLQYILNRFSIIPSELAYPQVTVAPHLLQVHLLMVSPFLWHSRGGCSE